RLAASEHRELGALAALLLDQVTKQAGFADQALLAVDVDDHVVLLENLRGLAVLLLHEVRREALEAQAEPVGGDALLLTVVGAERLERLHAQQAMPHGPGLRAPRDVFLLAPAFAERERGLRGLAVAVDLRLERAGLL